MAGGIVNKMKELVRGNNTCVLATTFKDKPHCSLMVYVADEDCGEIYMVTHRDTTKYRNLQQNPNVSLLIDTRAENPGEKRSEAKALTVAGEFQAVDDEEKKQMVLKKMLNVHPHLKGFLHDAGAEICSVKIKSFLLLEGVSNAYFESV